MQVAVTGGAGFIGANLVRYLVRQSHVDRVVAIDDLSTGARSNLENVDAELVVGTILDSALLDDVFEQADAIVHLAARPSVPRSIEDPAASHEANATGTLQVLDAARRAGGPQVIIASSSSVYGRSNQLPKHEELRPQPLSPYAASKLSSEAYAFAYAFCFDLDVLVFRFFNVFGPLQSAGHSYAAVIPAFIDAALKGRPLPVFGDGEQTRDFTYVESVASIISQAIRKGTTHEGPVNLAFGTNRSLLDVINDLSDILGYKLDVEHLPPRQGDVRHSQADQARIRALFPAVTPVPFRSGLKATVDWFRS